MWGLRPLGLTGTAVDWVLETGQRPPPPSLSRSRPASLLPHHVPRLPQRLLLGATWKWSPIQLIGSVRRPWGHQASQKRIQLVAESPLF